MRFALDQPGYYHEEMIMNDHKHRLVLACVVLVTEALRFGSELLAFLNMTSNYLTIHAFQMGTKIRT